MKKISRSTLWACLAIMGATVGGAPSAKADQETSQRYGRTERWNTVYQTVQKRVADHLLGRKTTVRTDQLTYWVSEAIFNAIQAEKKRFSPEKIQRLANRGFNRLVSSINYVITTPGLNSAEISNRFKSVLDEQGIL